MKKILIFGGSGLVGSKFIEIFDDKLEIESPIAEAVDILKKDQVSKIVEDFNPDSVINFAAYTNVEAAEKQTNDQEGIAYQLNVIGAKNVAEVCKSASKHLIHISTEYVFDGAKESIPYNEEDNPNPINWYGKTKYLGEQAVVDANGKNAIVRISMPYSSFYAEKKDVARFFLEQLKMGNKISAIEDQIISPTLTNDIAAALSLILERQSIGLYHISCTDPTSPLDFVKTIAEIFRLDYSLISSVSLEEYNKNKSAKLLKNSSLNCAKFEKEFESGVLRSIEEDLIIFKKEIDSDLIGVDEGVKI